MFCYQCEQTAQCKGCTTFGVCGKDPQTAALQDVLVYATKGLGMYAHRARELGAKDAKLDHAVVEALFTTVTNVNFDPKRIETRVREMADHIETARKLYEAACSKAGKAPEKLDGPAIFKPASSIEAMVKQGEEIAIPTRTAKNGEDLTGLQELLTSGIKGTAAYADHAFILGKEDELVYAFFHKALDYLSKPTPDLNTLVGLCMECGQVNLKAMELLDAANTGHFGHPVPTKVRVEPLKGKAILVSGHDLLDLENLLKQTEGKGINIYTHGEMLPAHGYPKLKQYKHLVGNYGGAWQDQAKEFAAFPGSILMTTNCIQKPQDSYKARIYTCGLVAWPGVTHINNHDFSPVIKAALEAPGFASDGSDKKIMVGFGHNAVMSVAGKVIDAVKAGQIKHFFLVGGCDGAKSGRNYYTDFAEKAPKDTVILTLACGKFRFNKMDLGEIGGIPRLLDVGQCNDAYSAVQIAVALAKAFNTDVNGLPLSMILSWYEQKAVCILLTLLSLGVKNIRLGPTLPAFVTPTVLKFLVEKFNIMPIGGSAKDDLKAILGANFQG